MAGIMQENPLLNYGKMLQGFRVDMFMSKTEVAQALGVTITSITNWENGVKLPRPEHRKAMAKMYRMPPEADLLSALRMYSKEELVLIVANLLERKG